MSMQVSDTKRKELRLISVKVPSFLLEQLDSLVEKGFFASRSEAIRLALSRLISRYNAIPRKIELMKNYRRDEIEDDELPF